MTTVARHQAVVTFDDVTRDYEIGVRLPDGSYEFVGYATTKFEAAERAHERIGQLLRMQVRIHDPAYRYGDEPDGDVCGCTAAMLCAACEYVAEQGADWQATGGW